MSNSKNLAIIAIVGLIIMAGGCVPGAAPQPTATPTVTPTVLADPSTEVAPAEEPPEPTPVSKPPSEPPTPRPGLEATDPSTVMLVSGQPLLVEFFAFW